MDHWYLKYIGTPYQLNIYDCAHMVEQVLVEQFGQDVVLPQHDNHRNITEACMEISKYQEQTGFKQIDDPHDGDVVLMKKAGLLHIGVYFTLAGIPHVLHNLAGCGVIAENIRTVNKVLGYYRWKHATHSTH